jgi:branched-chain amino acid transport system substrate-binding protein
VALLRKWSFLCLALLIAALVIAGCGDDDDSGDSGGSDTTEAKAEEKGPIVIGLTGSHSGFMSAFDVPAEAALKIAADDFNAEGGIDGSQVKFVSADSKTDPAQSAQAAEQVLADGADFVVTSCDYDVGGPAARIANENDTLAVSLCAGSPKWNAIGPLSYSMALGSETEGAAMAQWGYEKGGCKTAYLLTDTVIDYTKTVGDVAKEKFEGELVGEDTFVNDDQSFAGQVSRVQAANPKPDCIFLSSVPPGGVTLLRQLRSAGVDQKIIAAEGMGGDFWIKAVPDLSDFYYVGGASIFGDDPVETVNEVAAATEKDTGEKLTSATFVSGYSVLEAIKLGVERAGTTDTDAVVKEFQNFNDEELLMGPTSYSEDNRRSPGRPVRVIEFQNGKASFLEMFQPEL